MQDPVIEDALTEQRDRRVIVVAAVIGIIASIVCGLGFTLGMFGDEVRGAAGARNPAGLLFFGAPFVICLGIGHLVHRIVRARRAR